MREVISGLFMSVDGVVEAPDQWQFAFDEEMGEELQASLDKQDAVLLGRVTYQEWAGYWPTSEDEPFATWINEIPKYVASSTLETLEWSNSTLLQGDLAEAITKLKAEPGGTIGVAGSPGLVRSLIELDLLDELQLIVSPVMAGNGARLFEKGGVRKLELVRSRQTSTGTMVLTYRLPR